MPDNVQFAVLSKLRAAGVRDDATLTVSPADAFQFLDGTSGIIKCDFSRPEVIDTYETQDDEGRLDRQLPKGVGRIEGSAVSPTQIRLADVIP